MSMKHSLTRRSTLGLGLGALTLPFAGRIAEAADTSPVLIELFTSQGCSSCPAADKIAGELKKDPNNIVVSFNVDYWDYLGWRDTLAKPEYSQREHASGSSVTDLIAKARKASPAVNLTLEVTKKEIKVNIPDQAFESEATLWLMAIAPEIQQKIERGENSGMSITYHNAVRNLVPAAMWKGGAYQGSWMRRLQILCRRSTARENRRSAGSGSRLDCAVHRRKSGPK
jgi:hypothetical protein